MQPGEDCDDGNSAEFDTCPNDCKLDGGGASDAQVRGEVYNLHNLSDFAGVYTQNSGAAGFNKSTASDLWLRNNAGVVLHVTGTQTGMTLSLGREEILIELL